MSSRPNTPYRPRLCSRDVSKTDMERQAPDTRHQAAYIPDTCFVCVTIRRRHLDFTVSWCEDSGCFPPVVSETAAWNPMVRPSPKWWSTTTDRSDFTVSSPIPSMHLGVWACGSTWRRHTGKHGSSAAHQRIPQPTSWPQVASPTWSSTEQVTHLVTHLVWPHQPENSLGRPRSFMPLTVILIIISITSPTLSFIPDSKPSFFANPSHCSLSFFSSGLITWFPRPLLLLLAYPFLLFSFSVFLHFLVIGSVGILWRFSYKCEKCTCKVWVWRISEFCWYGDPVGIPIGFLWVWDG